MRSAGIRAPAEGTGERGRQGTPGGGRTPRARPLPGRPAPAAGAGEPRTVRELLRRPAIWGFVCTTACLEFCRGALFVSLLPAYLTDPRAGIGLDVADLGVVIAGQYLADTVFKVPAGWLVDRFGPWRVQLPLLSLAALAVYLLPRAHHLGLLLLLGLLFGCGASVNWPAVLAGSVHLGGMRSRASATSIVFTAWLAGGGPGPVLINFLLGGGYHTAFTLLAVVITGAPLAALLGVLGVLRRPDDPPWDPAATPPRETLADIAANLRAAAWLLPGMFVQMLALGMILPVLVPFARVHLHLASQAEYGLLLLAGGAVTVVFLVPMGRLVDRTGSKAPLVVGFALAAAALVLLAFSRRGQGLLWCVLALGFAYALVLPAWNGLTVGQIDADRRGVLLGLFMAIEGLGIAAGSAAGGALYGVHFRAPFFATAAILAGVAAFYLLVPAERFRARRGEEA
jgi:DHA1 family multidrug resistance protein-like MFS transporter